jgi:uncharacterized protein (TIGR03435 family)
MLGVAGALALVPLLAAPQDPAPRFEVASVKECQNTDLMPPSTSTPGRLSLHCWQLSRIIREAYDAYASGKVNPLSPGLPTTPIEGLPAWANSSTYLIEAKPESPQVGAMMRGPMMQALLEERFHLKIHRETREVAAYIMTVAKGGLKLQPTPEGSCIPLDPTDLAQPQTGSKPWCAAPLILPRKGLFVLDVHGITLDVFSKLLNPGRPVIDRTNLTGAYDIHLEWEPDLPAAATPQGAAVLDPGHSSAIEATRDQLGLRLDPGRGTREFLVIDHIEKLVGN